MLAASQIHMTVAVALHQVHHYYTMEERIECSLHGPLILHSLQVQGPIVGGRWPYLSEHAMR